MAALVTLVALAAGADTPAGGHPGAERFADELAGEGFDRDEILALLSEAERKESILEAMRRPAEAKPWHQYRPIFVTDERIAAGVRFWRRHAGLLARAEARYGVAPRIVVAVIGVETFYGRHTGGYRVLDALATLSFHYPPRATFFRSELKAFLQLTREEKLNPTEVKGSYAGAIGLGQFIPSSYRHYAVDFDDDGRRDLRASVADAIGSVANYLAEHGWQRDEGVALPARPRPDARRIDAPLKPVYPLEQLAQWGYDHEAEDASERLGTLITLDAGDAREHWIGLSNFYVITRYNHSELYAMAVHQLAEAIAQARSNARAQAETQTGGDRRAANGDPAAGGGESP